MYSYINIFEADDTRLIEDIHIESWKACNVELSSKTKVKMCIVSVYKTIKMSDTYKCRICSHIFDDMNRLNTHMNNVHDTAHSATPKIGQIVGILKITEGRGQDAGGRMQHKVFPKSTDPVHLYSLYSYLQNVNTVLWTVD